MSRTAPLRMASHFAIVAAMLLAAPSLMRADDRLGAPTAATNVSGVWNTTFGPVTLSQTGDRVSGSYSLEDIACSIQGRLDGRKLEFKYHEGSTQGEGHFEFSADGQSFRGQWRVVGGDAWNDWTGTRVQTTALEPAKPGPVANTASPGPVGISPIPSSRAFAGLWSTSFGPMRLTADGASIRGSYCWNGVATVEGRITPNAEFAFTYVEPNGQKGEGRFTLDADGETFAGTWSTPGGSGGEWTGKRMRAEPGRVWLIVLEANWEESLATPEFSYGQMLKSFFTRLPNVQVRHRFIHNASDFRRWAAEAAYFAEPVVLYISSHGTPAGAIVGGDIVGAQELIASLRHIDNLRLLHFGSCQVMAGEIPKQIAAARRPDQRFPISGFAKPADWAGSAIVDFTYLELVLGRGMDPREAAAQTRRLIKFADDSEQAPIAGSGFEIYAP